MTVEEDDKKSRVLKELFDEIMKMIREKQIKPESIIQNMIEQDIIPRDTFVRIYDMLTEHGKKKQWL